LNVVLLVEFEIVLGILQEFRVKGLELAVAVPQREVLVAVVVNPLSDSVCA